jgi:hypothetical protein
MARRRARHLIAAALGVAAVTTKVVTGCLDAPAVEELLVQPVVVTKRDSTADFTAPSTFAMPDSIPLLESIDAGPATETVDPAIAGPSLEEIAAQLSGRGYRRIAAAEAPDLGVAVTAVNQIRNQNISYGAWWGSGSSSTGFWGYGGATLDTPFSYSSIAWTSGTLIIELYDLRDARDAAPTVTAQVSVLWAAIIHGVIGPQDASLAAPPIALIRQAFAQSEYLRR